MTHLPEKTIGKAVDIIVQTLIETLASGQSIEIRDFGAFRLRSTLPRPARNPKTGEKAMTIASQKVHFKTGKGLQERINKAAGFDVI